MGLDLNDPLVAALQAHKEAMALPWAEIAPLVPMTPSGLMELARGEHTPSVATMQKLARYLGWGPAEVGQIMLYARGKSRKGRKNARKPNRESRSRSEPSVDADPEGRPTPTDVG